MASSQWLKVSNKEYSLRDPQIEYGGIFNRNPNNNHGPCDLSAEAD